MFGFKLIRVRPDDDTRLKGELIEFLKERIAINKDMISKLEKLEKDLAEMVVES